MTEKEAKLAQALSNCVWWMREAASRCNERATRAQLTLAAGDASKIVNAMLDGEELPEWLSPMLETEKEAWKKGKVQC